MKQAANRWTEQRDLTEDQHYEVLITASEASPSSPILDLIRTLCEMLAAEQIRYCHWKSNTVLERSATGQNDLDLLVHRGDLTRFTAILAQLGYREAIARSDKQLPGVLDYYGYDVPSNTLIHVHVHYQLILGHDAAKNYRLPIEEAYLASATRQDHFMVPATEFEFVVFVIRMMLKHGTWDAYLGLEGRFAKTELLEFEDLSLRADMEKVHAILTEYLPFLSVSLFAECIAALQGHYSLWQRWQIGYRLQQQLAAHTRRPAVHALFLRFWRRGLWGMRKYVLRQSTRKRFAAGGALIAIVGGDGAGKSSTIQETSSWLKQAFVVKRMHMGKPHMSLLSFCVKAVLKLGRKAGIWSTQFDDTERSSQGPQAFPGYPWLLWHVVTARDRYAAYRHARRLATNGDVVICDRFPLPDVKLMDGARTGWVLSLDNVSPLVKRLSKLEQAYYDHIRPPDMLLILRVDPLVAQQRRPDEEGEWVKKRAKEIWNITWNVEHYGSTLHIIDAGQPMAEVQKEVKSHIWAIL